MDDRDRPDIKVVHLRRKDDPDDAERRRLAETIFAKQDEVATFSQGNLLHPKPPAAPPPPAIPAAEPDPFFESLRNGSAESHPTASPLAGESPSTTEYFGRLNSQTPTEMSEAEVAKPAPPPMPGSAQLPAEVVEPAGHRNRRSDGAAQRPRPERSETPEIQRTSSRRRSTKLRMAWPAATASVVGVLAIAGAAFAAITATGDHTAAPAKRLAMQQPSPPKTSALVDAPNPPRRRAVQSPHSRTRIHHSARRRAAKPTAAKKIILAADRSPAVSPHATTASNSGSSGGTSSSSIAAIQQQTTHSSPDSTSSTSSGASNPPAFGANGTLGPGHSPNG